MIFAAAQPSSSNRNLFVRYDRLDGTLGKLHGFSMGLPPPVTPLVALYEGKLVPEPQGKSTTHTEMTIVKTKNTYIRRKMSYCIYYSSDCLGAQVCRASHNRRRVNAVVENKISMKTISVSMLFLFVTGHRWVCHTVLEEPNISCIYDLIGVYSDRHNKQKMRNEREARGVNR